MNASCLIYLFHPILHKVGEVLVEAQVPWFSLQRLLYILLEPWISLIQTQSSLLLNSAIQKFQTRETFVTQTGIQYIVSMNDTRSEIFGGFDVESGFIPGGGGEIIVPHPLNLLGYILIASSSFHFKIYKFSNWFPEIATTRAQPMLCESGCAFSWGWSSPQPWSHCWFCSGGCVGLIQIFAHFITSRESAIFIIKWLFLQLK